MKLACEFAGVSKLPEEEAIKKEVKGKKWLWVKVWKDKNGGFNEEETRRGEEKIIT